MARRKVTKARKALLIELESMIGNECYNANIQNWGPVGVFEGEGREFRYPITFRDEEGRKVKKRSIDGDMSGDTVLGSYYAFGANELHIMNGLNQVLDYLEREYQLKIGKRYFRCTLTRALSTDGLRIGNGIWSDQAAVALA
ncbi:hypothetical protein NKI25_34525, partial [Mesorhizobium sp. M0808]